MIRLLTIMGLALLVISPARAEVRLLMIEAPGCTWCARWHAEVGDAYSMTSEGRVAPLLRVDRSQVPPDVILQRPTLFTPTFVLLNGGQEVGRIEGYPGEHFFWPLLGQLIDDLPTDLKEDVGS